MIRIRTISTSDPFYEQACALRESALLADVGLDMPAFRRQFPGLDERSEHFVAVLDHPLGSRVVGTVMLLPDGDEARLLQLVVDPQRQGEGIGRRLVAALESRAFGQLGLRSIYCHAHESARGFYERLGWTVDGKPFLEAGVPHVRMVMQNQAAPADYA